MLRHLLVSYVVLALASCFSPVGPGEAGDGGVARDGSVVAPKPDAGSPCTEFSCALDP
jgi:hypothetical protein